MIKIIDKVVEKYRDKDIGVEDQSLFWKNCKTHQNKKINIFINLI